MAPYRVFLFLGCVFLAGCVSSEGTGGGDHARIPVQILGPIDTVRHFPHGVLKKDTASLANAQTNHAGVNGKLKTAPRFKSKQDTLKASIVVKKKSPARIALPIDRSNHAGFTVQIGAFRGASNALRAQKNAKARFNAQPVFNQYITKANMYRVSIGKFEDRTKAFSFLEEMKKRFPKEYTPCWINFLPR
ncbi:MAG TPA: SPOR domain-containing protein [Bacteroidota bacterium]|nr:SPOR domain-containing protein [Bacteroidota bacterium]